MTQQSEDRFRGCLLGGAIGDAMGMPVTGMSREEILALGAVRDFQPSRGAVPIVIPVADLGDSELGELLRPGQWTEDTQLTLALAQTLLEEGGSFIPESWAHNLVRWVHSAPRSPGLSTLQAALQLRTGGVFWDEAADPEGAGCGPAARVAPIALRFAQEPDRRRHAAVLQAQVTHGHPDAHAAALAVAEAIAFMLAQDRNALSDWNGIAFLHTLIETVRSASPDFAAFARCLELARTLLADQVDMATAIRVLGVSGWSREAVPCALYCVAYAPQDFETLLLSAVNLTGGAVDSIAAMVGAIGGALHGWQSIPLRWREGVEDAERLVETAQSLYRLSIAP
jgi:ADP-ribosyl-[dinitrogen reductase] hydrolase